MKKEEFTSGQIDCVEMLKAIARTKPKNAFLVVFPADGSFPTFHSSTGKMKSVLAGIKTFMSKYKNGDFDK